jgi:hypothetical protein
MSLICSHPCFSYRLNIFAKITEIASNSPVFALKAGLRA